MNNLDHLEVKRAMDNLNSRMMILNMSITDFDKAVRDATAKLEELKKAIEQDKNFKYKVRPIFDTNLIFTRKEDAEEVLGALKIIVSNTGKATLENFFDVSGMGTCPEDKLKGWTDLSGADVKEAPDGFAILFPRFEDFS